jgi:hypothetical protein
MNGDYEGVALRANRVSWPGSLGRKQMDVAMSGPILGVDLAASFARVVSVGEKNAAAGFDHRLGQGGFVARRRSVLPRQKGEDHLRFRRGIDEERRRDGEGVESQVPSGVGEFIDDGVRRLFLPRQRRRRRLASARLRRRRRGTSEHFFRKWNFEREKNLTRFCHQLRIYCPKRDDLQAP